MYDVEDGANAVAVDNNDAAARKNFIFGDLLLYIYSIFW